MTDAAQFPGAPSGLPDACGLAQAGALPGRILIVEDEWLVSSEIEELLSEHGYEVCGCAVSADEAVDLAARHRPDLIIMDIRLKGVRDGVDAALAIHRAHGIRCLFISANSDPGNQARAAEAEPAGWLPKPFAARRLLDSIAVAMKDMRR